MSSGYRGHNKGNTLPTYFKNHM